MKKLENLTEPELKALMDTMGLMILRVAEHMQIEKPMFALLLFNDPKLSQYCSNCNRADMIKALREAADHLERDKDGVTR